MALEYRCPKCDVILNPNVRVILVAKFNAHKSIALFSSRLGDYHIICDNESKRYLIKGKVAEFFCPVCSESLTCPEFEEFAELKVINTDKPDHKTCLLRFSRTCQEHATFLYDGDTVRGFGEEADLFKKKIEIEGDWGW